MRNFKVYLAPAQDYAASLRQGLAWLGAEDLLTQAEGIFIKPNLTFPGFRPGVTTTKEVIYAAIQVFKEFQANIVVGEADGGYGAYDVEAAFKAFDLFKQAEKFGAQVVNLSQVPTAARTINTRKGKVTLELPKFLVEGNFITVTLPVPKVHCMTGISLSYKNQWGCIPDMMRLRQHYYFNEIIGPLNSLLKVRLAIVDGTYGLTRNGPIIEGLAVRPNWLIMSSHPGAADRLAAHLMGLALEDYPHYQHIHRSQPLPELGELEISRDVAPFLEQAPKFYLKRNFWNYVAKTTWYSKRWSHLVYESNLAGLLHKIMYSFRDRPAEFRDYRPPQ